MPVIGNLGPDNTSLKTVYAYEKHTQKAAQNICIFADFLPASLHSQLEVDTKGKLTNDRVRKYKEGFSKDFQN
jgi:hypothetical protein